MPCYGPLQAFRPVGMTGRLVFDKRKSHSGVAINVPCGRCAGCKLEHSRQWAIRCMHELRSHHGAPSSFLTLTYEDRHLPPGRSLDLQHYQKFLKRLRSEIGPGLRFFGCGEYGEKFGRPHYHLITFNYRPTDTKLLKRGAEFNYYSSKSLDDLWGLGNTIIGDVSFHSCGYVARYCMKKITGDKSAAHYQGRLPEFLTMSLKPGIGQNYFAKYHTEIYNHDSVIIDGHAAKPPRFYDNKFDQIDANMLRPIDQSKLSVIKRKRAKLARIFFPKSERTNRRRVTSELVMLAKLKQKAKTL